MERTGKEGIAMKVFIICPVRKVRKRFSEKVFEHVNRLEADGHTVYFPPRDTDQEEGGFEICLANRKAIESCDEVHIFYDGKSEGVLFDFGMVFAFGKKLQVINIPEENHERKSFIKVMNYIDDLYRTEEEWGEEERSELDLQK